MEKEEKEEINKISIDEFLDLYPPLLINNDNSDNISLLNKKY